MTTTQNYLTSLAEVRATHDSGFGSFAVAPIPRGTVVATFGGTGCNRSTFDAADEERRSRSIQIDDDLFLLGPPQREPGDCVNHSCNPNCGPRNAVQIVAMRDIAIGEELTFDYGTTDGSDYDQFECACGHKLCRGTVSGSLWRNPEMQSRYKGWFSPYLQRRIDASLRGRVLTKSEVELLLDSIDTDPVQAVTRALRVVLGRPHTDFIDLVALLPCSDDVRIRLLDADTTALDDLAKDLNESRGRDYIGSP